MDIKKLVPVLTVITLIAFGVGLWSLKYNDNVEPINSKVSNILNIHSNDGSVKIGEDGIKVRDGSDRVSIGVNGIKVEDNGDEISIGWDGIKIKDRNRRMSSFKSSWININSNDMEWEIVDEEEFSEIDGVNNIIVSSPFIDTKVISEDREDVHIRYYGRIKTNVVPTLKVDKISNKINIELDHDSNNYSVVESKVLLEVFVPRKFDGEFNIISSSSDIDVRDLIGKGINITSSSGDLKLENLKADIFNLSTSSGEIQLKNLIGETRIVSKSGDIYLDNSASNENVNISTSSGDVSIKLSENANYAIKGSTSSGELMLLKNMDIKTNQRGVFEAIIGSKEKSMEVNTLSGDIEFEK